MENRLQDINSNETSNIMCHETVTDCLKKRDNGIKDDT